MNRHLVRSLLFVVLHTWHYNEITNALTIIASCGNAYNGFCMRLLVSESFTGGCDLMDG